MKWKILVALVAALSLMAPAVSADILQGTGLAGWQPYPIDGQQNNQPYWDGSSADPNPPATVGNFLTGTGAFFGNPNSPNLTNPQWWGNAMAPGAADLNMSFQSTAVGSGATLLIEVAGLAPSNVFGWYDVSNPGLLNSLFTGFDGAGTISAPFIVPVGNNFGFYLSVVAHNGNPAATYYMDSNLNKDSSLNQFDTQQHFAIFRVSNATDLVTYPNSFFIGVEDQPIVSGIIGDRDFQDMVVRFNPQGGGGQVPLPPSALLLGSGLLGLLILRRTKR